MMLEAGGERMRRIATLVFLCIGLAACEPRGEIRMVPPEVAQGDIETVFVGTTRGTDVDTAKPFGRARSADNTYARLSIAVPPDRSAGVIRWSHPNRAADPRTEFLATAESVYGGPTEFRADLARTIAANPRGRREAIVFVHGFNSTYAEGVYRVAQLGHDLDLSGTLVHYSWPSRAHPLGYAYDRDSALFARDGLERLLDQVVAAGAERITLVAHSMGSALTMETLRQAAIAKDQRLLSRIAGVVLISPDIDVDVFRAQAVRIGRLPQPFFIFTSKKDRALALSARLTGQRDRLGNITDIEELADLQVTVLDTTAFSTGAGHFNVGNSPALLSVLSGMADIDSALAGDPSGRAGLLPGAILTVQGATQIVLSPVTALSGLQN